MNIRSPIGQTVFLLFLSCIIGFSSNLFSSNSIPWIAPELTVVEEIDTSTDEAVLVAISLEQAKTFFDDGVLFVDARDEGYYESGHIQGAMRKSFLPKLIFNIEERQGKDVPLVVYCGDPGCGDSEQLAYDLKDSGFTKLYVFKGGWVEWSGAAYPSQVD